MSVLPALLGSWQLKREIRGEGASMMGEAEFVAEGAASALYRERGRLILPGGQVIEAYRQYRFSEADGSLLIDFADGPDTGKRFVSLRFDDRGHARAVHPCDPDRYDVTWRLALPAAFETDIAVTGPRKNYRAITHYTRA